ncbi:MAG TPA: FKBP-type peptidyl-prolyl cis-trans isomerase, partial [Terrimesophilobacter sp.]|nr:FKBP-type peptidyl-prolyl cis-trans isomerase [Terrimesophilobacter sp.]
MPATQHARSALSALAAATLLLSLAACTPATPEPEPDPGSGDVCATPSGDAVASIEVTGGFGSEPTVAFEPGLTTPHTQRLIITQGDGGEVAEGSTVTVAYAIYGGTSGERIESQGFDDIGAVPLVADTNSLMPGLLKTLGCVNAGSRVVSTIAPSDAFGEQGFSNEQLTIPANETLVVVMDVVRILDRAWGVDEPATEGMPQVTLIAEGEPVVTIPDEAPPSELQIAVLKRGDGDVVAEGS